MTPDESDEGTSSDLRRLQERLHAVTRPVERLQRTLGLKWAPIRFPSPGLSKQLNRIGQVVTRILEELPDRQREALIKMAQYGWYMDSEMGLNDSVRWARALAGPNAEAANDELCTYFDNRLASLEAALREKYPLRASVLSAAFNAHRRGDYYCSIPVLLSQTEGICNELVGKSPYSRTREDGQPLLRTIINSFDSVRAAFAAPLGVPTPLIARPHERQTSNPKLNRHAILHGESVDYGTHEVSARAISFLAYVSWTLDTKDDEASGTGPDPAPTRGVSASPSSGEV